MSQGISIRDAARLLGVHENTIRNWIRDGVIGSSTMPGPSGYRRVNTADVRDRIRSAVWQEAADYMAEQCEIMAAQRERVRGQGGRDWPGSYLADRESHRDEFQRRADHPGTTQENR